MIKKKLNRILLIICIITLIIPFTFGAEYDIDITYDFEDEVQVGTFNIGNMIFQPKIVNRTIHEMNNASIDYTITREDSIQNKFNFSIIINDIIVVQNEILKFTNVGENNVLKLSDNSTVNKIFVTEITPQTVKLSENDNVFGINFSEYEFNIDNVVERTVNLTINSSMRVIPAKYEVEFFYEFKGIENTKEIEFHLMPFENINITIDKCTNEMPIMTHGVFCEFNIENTGNTMVDLGAEIQGFSEYFYFPENIGTFPSDKRKLVTYYDITQDPPLTGNYLYNVSFKTKNNTYNVPVNFSFVDRIFPFVRNLSIPNLEVYRSFNSTIQVIENYNLSMVKARLYKENDDFELIEEWDLPKDRFDWYKLEFMPLIEGRYKVEVWVKDRAENLNISEEIFIVNKLNAITDFPNVRFKKVKFDKYIYSPLFYLDKDIEVNFKVTELNYNNCSSWSMMIRNEDNGQEAFVEEIESPIKFNKKGNYTIGFKGSCTTDLFNGKMSISTPIYHREVEDLIFSGEVIDYQIPEKIKDKEWNDGILNCDSIDTGVVETSKYKCTVEYPLSKDNLDIIPVSVETYDKTIADYESKIKDLKSSNFFKVLFIITLFVVIILLSVGCTYFILIHPTLRFRLGK